MVSSGGFLTQLSTSPVGADKYFALASDYTPPDPGLKAWAANHLLDRVFQKAANDLVVSMLGVYDENGCGYFRSLRSSSTARVMASPTPPTSASCGRRSGFWGGWRRGEGRSAGEKATTRRCGFLHRPPYMSLPPQKDR